MNRRTLFAGGLLLALGIVSLPALLLGKNSPTDEIITRTGLHWHSHLDIFLKGQKVAIPANIGIYKDHEEPIHTHANDGTIHLEFLDTVTKKDLVLGRFFQIWGKTFNRHCLWETCTTTPATLVKMFVNDQPNLAYENYSLKDGDKIELRLD